MSRATQKNAVKRIMLDGNIDFEKIDYETIRERHRARLMLVQEWFYNAHAKRKSHEPEIRAEIRAMLRHGKLAEEILRAKSLLKDDTPELWAADQAAIEAYELRQHGTLSYVKRSWAYGATPEEMYEHWRERINEPERLERARQGRRRKERAELVKKHGMLVRLRAENPYNSHPWYIPEFADGTTHPEMRHLYTSEEFPECKGRLEIVFDKDES